MQFRLADLDIRSVGTDDHTPAGHVSALGLDPLGNFRVFLYEGTEPADDRFVGSLLIPKNIGQPTIAYGSRGEYVTSSGSEAEKFTKLVARHATSKS